MKHVVGNLLTMFEQGELDVIIHGCNCGCNMGSGIAKEVRERFPQAYEADLKTNRFDTNKLGTYSCAIIGSDKVIINAYTQFDWKGKGDLGGPLLSYNALVKIFKQIKKDFGGRGLRFGIPAIGAARAGGDWNIIKFIIDYELRHEDVTFVEFDGVDKFDYKSDTTNMRYK